MKKIKHPLGQEHLDQLNRLLQSCADTEAYCGACNAAHINVSKEREANDEQRKIAEALKATFFPSER